MLSVGRELISPLQLSRVVSFRYLVGVDRAVIETQLNVVIQYLVCVEVSRLIETTNLVVGNNLRPVSRNARNKLVVSGDGAMLLRKPTMRAN